MSDDIEWFENYNKFTYNLTKKNLEKDLKDFNVLFTSFSELNNRRELYERKVTTDYNIFYLLKYVLDKEEQTHSPFLTDLLNVNGKHKQADLFYSAFLRCLKIMGIEQKFQADDPFYFYAQTEKWIGNGFIDIFLTYSSPQKQFAIAIENKVFAKDQEKQLQRYSEYLQKEFDSNFLLLYLTPNVQLPSIPYSIEQARFNELTKLNLLKCITYSDHIAALLNETIPNIQSKKVSYIVEQYSQIIKNNFQ
jgi:hypothetical protein